jgi:hypothetical protein
MGVGQPWLDFAGAKSPFNKSPRENASAPELSNGATSGPTFGTLACALARGATCADSAGRAGRDGSAISADDGSANITAVDLATVGAFGAA